MNHVSNERIEEARRTVESSLEAATIRIAYLFDKTVQHEGEPTINKIIAHVAQFTAGTYKL